MPTEDVKDVAGDVMKAFESFKETNDKRLAEIEKKGVADPVTLDKLAKIDVALNAGEELNQKLTLAAKQAEKMAEEQKALAEIVERLEAKLGRPGACSADEAKEKAAAYKAAFNSYLLSNAANGEAPSNDEFKLLNEYKVLQAGTDTLGGFYLAPSDMANEIIKNVVLQSPIRSIARVTAIGVKSLILPKRTGTFAATRVGELAARTETTGYTTGQVEIHCDEMYAEVRISQQMIEDSLFNIEAEMGLEFAEQFAVKEGTEFVSGTGVNGQAEGFLTNADILSQDSGAATTIADADGQANGLITLFYSKLKTAYARNATWTLNRATLGSVRKLKSTDKQYIWLPGVAGGVPNTILGSPYVECPDMPNEGAGTYPIAVGDFNAGYRIVDRVLLSVLRDPYTQSGSGQILFRARKRVGGAVVKSEAIAKLKCAA